MQIDLMGFVLMLCVASIIWTSAWVKVETIRKGDTDDN